MDDEQYAALLARMRALDLSAEAIVDIEAYRAHCQRHAYETGVVAALAHHGLPIEFPPVGWNPFHAETVAERQGLEP